MAKENLDIEVEKIWRELGITGDIGFDEKKSHFWKRKVVETYKKTKLKRMC